MMAYPSPPCPWDETNLPLLRWDLSPLQKLCPQSWKFWPFTSHPFLYLAPLWMPPARILFPFTQGRIHIISSCLNLLPNGIHMRWNAQPESGVDKCVWNSDKRGDVIETNGSLPRVPRYRTTQAPVRQFSAWWNGDCAI